MCHRQKRCLTAALLMCQMAWLEAEHAKGKRSHQDVLQTVSDAVLVSANNCQAKIKVNQKSERPLLGRFHCVFRVLFGELTDR